MAAPGYQAVKRPLGDESIVDIVHRGRVVFSKVCGHPSNVMVRWSHSGRAMGIFENLHPCNQLTVWTPTGVRSVRHPALDGEPPFEMRFAPDDARVLLRIPPVMGHYDVDTGHLVCVHRHSGRVHRIAARSVRRAQFTSGATIRYWTARSVDDSDPAAWPLTRHEVYCPVDF